MYVAGIKLVGHSVITERKGWAAKLSAKSKNANLEIGVPGFEVRSYPPATVGGRHPIVNRKEGAGLPHSN